MSTHPLTIPHRFLRLLRRLPQSTMNSLRFRVPYLLPRWFKIPSQVRVCGRSQQLRFPENENADSDFIECFLLNAYGLGRELGDVRSILDVGANVGFFALAARHHYPQSTIHAYEPNPRVLPYLESNTAGLNVSIFPEAVGSDECFVTILDEGPSDEARTRRAASGNGGIRQVTLATAIQRMNRVVDLLKLDCEGAEWEILKADGCWDRVRNLRMEIHFFNGETLEQARAALRQIRFEIIYEDVKNDEMAMIWAQKA